jgi:hypothetical protein
MNTIFRHPQFSLSICLRLALVALVAGVALSQSSRQVALAGPANPVNVGANPIRVVISYPPRDNASSDQSKWTQSEPLKGSALASQPLSTPFDTAWAKPTNNGKSMRESSCDKATKQIKDAVVAADSSLSAYDVSCNFPATGTLTASVGPDWEIQDCADTTLFPNGGPPCHEKALVLTYSLPGNSVSFAITKPDMCTGNAGEVVANIFGGGVACANYAVSPDPRFTLSFDAEFDAFLLINNNGSCLVMGNADEFVQNAKLSADNYMASAAMQFKPELKSGAEAANKAAVIDLSSMGLDLGSTLTSLDTLCDSMKQQGFQFDVSLDNNQVTLAITHPLDKVQMSGNGPQTPAPAGSTPFTSSLFTPEIVAAPTTVPLNGNLRVTGNSFPGSNASQMQVRWADSSAEQFALKESDINWGTPGNLQQVTLPRSSNVDQGNVYLATNLKPATKYQFSVRDCDGWTCSQWSDPLFVTTDAETSNQLSIYLDSIAPANALATATPDPSGAFTKAIQIPASATAGAHTLIAVSGNSNQASAQFTVLGANQTASPQISFVGGSPTNGVWSVTQDDPYSVQGSYFTPSGKVSIYLDSSSGQSLGTATVGSDGTFQMKVVMSNVANNHTLLAIESFNGQLVQASMNLNVQTQIK